MPTTELPDLELIANFFAFHNLLASYRAKSVEAFTRFYEPDKRAEDIAQDMSNVLEEFVEGVIQELAELRTKGFPAEEFSDRTTLVYIDQTINIPEPLPHNEEAYDQAQFHISEVAAAFGEYLDYVDSKLENKGRLTGKSFDSIILESEKFLHKLSKLSADFEYIFSPNDRSQLASAREELGGRDLPR
ncbi:MAG TPA: hypothetical protein PKB15_05935 [Acidimicrobiia bacterium]|nr:hypothetical protein [Acidimicrobiia bacterium]